MFERQNNLSLCREFLCAGTVQPSFLGSTPPPPPLDFRSGVTVCSLYGGRRELDYVGSHFSVRLRSESETVIVLPMFVTENQNLTSFPLVLSARWRGVGVENAVRECVRISNFFSGSNKNKQSMEEAARDS